MAAFKPSRQVQFIPISPTAQLRKCRFCPKMIYLSPHPTTKRPHPIAVDTHPASYPPSGKMYGQGVSHYADCPGAHKARKRKAKVRLAVQAELAL
jgi:hypothetical protein